MLDTLARKAHTVIMNHAPTMLRSAAQREHVLRGGRACPCCCGYGSTKSGRRNRQIARQAQRQVEKRSWKAEVA